AASLGACFCRPLRQAVDGSIAAPAKRCKAPSCDACVSKGIEPEPTKRYRVALFGPFHDACPNERDMTNSALWSVGHKSQGADFIVNAAPCWNATHLQYISVFE